MKWFFRKRRLEDEFSPEQIEEMKRQRRLYQQRELVRQARISAGQAYADGRPIPRRDRLAEIKDIGRFL